MGKTFANVSFFTRNICIKKRILEDMLHKKQENAWELLTNKKNSDLIKVIKNAWGAAKAAEREFFRPIYLIWIMPS